jgi:hypothetical protein
VARLGDVMGRTPEALRAVGTDDAVTGTPKGAQRQVRQSGRESGQSGTSGCNQSVDEADNKVAVVDCPTVLPFADIVIRVRSDATKNESGGQGTRTLNRRTGI